MHNFLDTKYAKEPGKSTPLDFTYCDYLNISVCRITETEKSFIINVYNPVGESSTHSLRTLKKRTSFPFSAHIGTCPLNESVEK